jgi:hypothetical protein
VATVLVGCVFLRTPFLSRVQADSPEAAGGLPVAAMSAVRVSGLEPGMGGRGGSLMLRRNFSYVDAAGRSRPDEVVGPACADLGSGLAVGAAPLLCAGAPAEALSRFQNAEIRRRFTVHHVVTK